MGTTRGSDGARIRCDLSPTQREWGFDAFRTMARLLGDQEPVDRGGWLFTQDELQVEGLEMEAAITVARGGWSTLRRPAGFVRRRSPRRASPR
jgi:hypothetical protein